jgi:hypothetical protein
MWTGADAQENEKDKVSDAHTKTGKKVWRTVIGKRDGVD